jgi:hypothetical protein
MFAQNVWDPCASLSRHAWTTLLSFTLQLAGVGMLLVLPLIYPGGRRNGSDAPYLYAASAHGPTRQSSGSNRCPVQPQLHKPNSGCTAQHSQDDFCR